MTPAARVADHLRAHEPRLGPSRLVCVDGPSGSGKTTLAAAVAELVGATVLHTDEYCPGWDGLPAVPGLLADLLADLDAGRPARIRTWDWLAGRPGEPVLVAPAPILVIEGVGAGALDVAPWTTTLVHLDGEPAARRARALARDDYFAEHWDAWAAAEQRYFRAHQVRSRADLTFP